MKTRAKLYGIFLPAFLIVMPTCAVLRTVACLNDLDESGHYFESSMLINISNAIVVAAMLFFLSYIWCARKDVNLIPSFTSAANYIPCALVCAALAFISFHLLTIGLEEPIASTFTKKFALATACLGVLAIGYFAISAVYVTRRSIKRSNYGILMLVFLCAYIAFIYFDTTLPLNAPNKIVDEMAYLFVALFFLYETRLSLGREKWRQYISFGFMAALLTAYSSIPSLVLYFVRAEVISVSIYESILTFTLFIFILFKLLLAGTLVSDKTSPVVAKIIEASRARSEQLEPEIPEEPEMPEEEKDENQISFSDIEVAEEEAEDTAADSLASTDNNDSEDAEKEVEPQ